MSCPHLKIRRPANRLGWCNIAIVSCDFFVIYHFCSTVKFFLHLLTILNCQYNRLILPLEKPGKPVASSLYVHFRVGAFEDCIFASDSCL